MARQSSQPAIAAGSSVISIWSRGVQTSLVEPAIEPYARTLPADGAAAATGADARLEQQAAYWLQLDAINFGSGWFPTLRKPAGMSGFRTVEAGLTAHGPWPAASLAGIDAAEIAAALGQDPEHELMALFARHLRELGERVRDEHGGSFLALARAGDGSAVALAERLGSWPTWRDVSVYDGEAVPLFKRAQLAAADLALAGVA